MPAGCAHGFVVTGDHAVFLYKVTDYWAPQHERTILWNDPRWREMARCRSAGERQGRRWSAVCQGANLRVTSNSARPNHENSHRWRPRPAWTGAGASSRRCAPAAAPLVGDFDITNRERCAAAVTDTRPDLVLNCAAYTAVDRAESERDAAFAVNAGRGQSCISVS